MFSKTVYELVGDSFRPVPVASNPSSAVKQKKEKGTSPLDKKVMSAYLSQRRSSREDFVEVKDVDPLLGGLRNVIKTKGMHFDTSLFGGDLVTSASTAGSYLLRFNNINQQFWAINNVSSAVEWSSFAALFDEFFVKAVAIRFQPIQDTAGALINSTATNLQNLPLTLGEYQHDAAKVTDNSTAWITLAGTSKSKFMNTNKPWSYTWKNCEKFSYTLPMGDQTTSSCTQTWCLTSAPSKYGGFIQVGTQYVSSATPNQTAIGQSVALGSLLVEYRVAFRARS